MFKFLFGRKEDAPVVETQRQVATRALEELNTVLEGLETKPAVKLDMNTGQIEVDWPEQMPDEALALPAPEDQAPADAVKPAETAKDKVEELAAKVEEAAKEGAKSTAA